MLPLSAHAARNAPSCKSQAAAYAKTKSAPSAFALAACNEEAGKLKTATDQYGGYLRIVKRLPAAKRRKEQSRSQTAKQRVKAMRHRMPLLSFKLPGDVSDYTVKVDGEELSEADLRYAKPMDPGEYAVEIELPNGALDKRMVELAEGDSEVVKVGGASRLDPAPVDPAPKSNAWVEEPEPLEEEDAAQSEPIPMRTWAYVAGGVGAAGLLVGAITGGLAIGEKSTIDDNCDGQACNHDGKVAADDAQALALGSTISSLIGLAAVGAGAALWFFAPEGDGATQSDEVSLELVVRGNGAGLRGSW